MLYVSHPTAPQPAVQLVVLFIIVEKMKYSSVYSRPVYKYIPYLSKCYLFVIYALLERVFVFYLFKIDLNTI